MDLKICALITLTITESVMVSPSCDSLNGEMLGNAALPNCVEIGDSFEMPISDHCSCGNIVAPHAAHCQADDHPAQYAKPAMTLLMCGEVTGRVAVGRLTPQPSSNIRVCKMAFELYWKYVDSTTYQHIYCERFLQSVAGRVSACCNSVIHIVQSLWGTYSLHSCTAQDKPGRLTWVQCGL
jgi:hypothetical protein